MECILFIYYLLVVITLTSIQINAESMLNWIWGRQEELPTVLVSDGVPLISIPYEMLTEDEKFLKEAAKFVTDIQISSPLEICQHKVVLKIKTACTSITEEQLAKLSVNLLNCQSAVEGRKIFSCTEEMSIKECTTNMDADTWNAYHLMSNRARAICYSARSHQFRALTELTVNKLMQSAHSQIKTLASLKESQDRLEEQTINAHKIIESNIQDLTDEKALILAGHSQLASMTEDIKNKIEKASQDFLKQAAKRTQNHQEILADLKSIQTHAQLLWEKVENSTNCIIKQNSKTILQYEKTFKKIEKINETIVFIWDLTNNMRSEIDKKLEWITEYIGTTGENLEKVYRISLHVIYLFVAMIIAAFLQAPFLTRVAILGIVPLNLIAYLKHGLHAGLDFISLSVLLLLITGMHYLMNGIQYMLQSKSKTIKKNKNLYETSLLNGKVIFNEDTEKYNINFEDRKQKSSLRLKVSQYILNLWHYVYQQVFQNIENLKASFLMKSWIWQKFVPMEELSCSYVASKKYDECIISEYPSISDDSSDYSDLRSFGKFVLSDNNSITGAVLKQKNVKTNISSLNNFLKRNQKTIKIDQPIIISSQSVTPITKALCGAKTRSGNPCRLLPSKGQNYCYRHVSS